MTARINELVPADTYLTAGDYAAVAITLMDRDYGIESFALAARMSGFVTDFALATYIQLATEWIIVNVDADTPAYELATRALANVKAKA